MTHTGTRITVKSWLYKDAQSRAHKYNFTLIWENACFNDKTGAVIHDTDIEDFPTFKERGYQRAYNLVGNITKETEKAVLVECLYWNLNRAGRYVTDAPVCEGFKVWVPKTAILHGYKEAT